MSAGTCVRWICGAGGGGGFDMRVGLVLLLHCSAMLLGCASGGVEGRFRTLAAGRGFADGVVVSDAQPAISVRVDPALEYAGTLTFVLGDVADAQAFVFVDADETGFVRRSLLVQFEQFRSDNTHTYGGGPQRPRVKLGRHAYAHNINIFPRRQAIRERPASDTATIERFLVANGYSTPDVVAVSRYVRVLGEDRRAEMLIVYAESVDGAGLTPEDLPWKGEPTAAGAAFRRGFVDRALASFDVESG
jgi:hypothetical protein